LRTWYQTVGRHGRVLQREPGSSRLSFSVWRKAGRRSAVDGAMVERAGQCDHRPHDRLAADGTDALLGRADGDDRRLRGFSTAVKLSTAYMPRFEIVNVPPSSPPARSFASAARPTRSARTPGDLGEREPARRCGSGHDETLGCSDGEADVRARVKEDCFLGELRVHLAMTHERLRAYFREDVRDR
jgi:hypothetical protein